jgi:hypothetical protein
MAWLYKHDPSLKTSIQAALLYHDLAFPIALTLFALLAVTGLSLFVPRILQKNFQVPPWCCRCISTDH